MRRFYSILILGLFCICPSFGITTETSHFKITVSSEIIPEFKDNELKLCRVTKEMGSDVVLLSQTTELKAYTDLISHLLSDPDPTVSLDVLVDNFVKAKFEPNVNKDLLDFNLPIVSALINITTTLSNDIERKLIKTYESKTQPSEIYPIQLFKITNEHDEDITSMLAGKLTGVNLTKYLSHFREKVRQIIFTEQSSGILQYQRSIINLISEIIKLKDEIFKVPLHTKISYYIDFMVKYTNKIVADKANQFLTIGGVNVLIYPITSEDIAPFFLLPDSGFKKEDITRVQQLKHKVEKSQNSLDLILLKPLKGLSQEEDKLNFAAYIQFLQLFIKNPYR